VRGLYAILDLDFLASRRIPFGAFAERVLSARPAVVQLRAKNASAAEALRSLRDLRRLASTYGVPLFANDRPDLAILADCDGVHVGQDDLDVEDVRRFAPALRVGVSTHRMDQFEVALAAAPDYVAFGPVFRTSSKADAEPVVGIAGLEAAGKRAGSMPLVAIGGIDVENASSIARHASMGAVIRGLLPEDGLDGVARRVEKLHRALGGTPSGETRLG
jgi:thiamine-phosphate pyrophosphorylase